MKKRDAMNSPAASGSLCISSFGGFTQSFLKPAAVAVLLGCLSGFVTAQEKYPSKPVRLVIPFAAGGSTDIIGRRLGEKLGADIGTTFIADNQGGAGGAIGAADVVHAKPDGYTLLFSASSTQVIVPLMMDPRPYDGVKDFAAISLVGLQYLTVVAGPAMPAKNARELVATLRANPRKYAYASAGTGSINHFAGEIFNRQAGVQVVHVPYKGGGAMINDLIGGHIALMMATTGTVLDQVRAGKIRLLATFSERRLASTPEVPTAIEAGVPDMVVSTFSGLFGPAATPRPVIGQLHQAMTRVMADSDFQKNLLSLGIEPVTDSTPESTTRYVIDATNRLAPIIKALGTQPR